MKIAFVLFIIHSSLWALNCKNIKEVGEYLNMNSKDFKKNYQKHHALHKSEPVLKVGDFNQALSVAYKLQILKDFGLDSLRRTPFIVKMQKSSLFGKRSGWIYTNEIGDLLTVRFDYDPVKGAHLNIIHTDKNSTSKETSKLAIEFDCNGRPCTEREVLKMAEQFN
jgi:hypothetical protein